MGKDLTELRNLHRQLVPDRVGPGEHEPTFLREIAIKWRKPTGATDFRIFIGT
jgi:hypothetical protein